MLNCDICEIISEPNWINIVFSANISNILVVTIGETFIFLVWIFPTMLAGILLNKDIFTNFNSIFLEVAYVTDDCISNGVERIVKQVSVALQMSPLCLHLNACDVLSPVEPET